jgi:hypothetical protein
VAAGRVVSTRIIGGNLFGGHEAGAQWKCSYNDQHKS